MRQRQATTQQVNVRLDKQFVRQLETRAKENRSTFSVELRKLIDTGAKGPLSLADFRAEWLRLLRDAIEDEAREEGKDIVEGWGIQQAVEVLWSHFYGAVEDKLSPRATNARIRELLRGAPKERERDKS